jgi:DNA-binding GntR family transcriptional regulator
MRNASDKRTHLGGLMDKSTLVDQVYRALRDRILGGEFSPGEKLSLSGLAKDLEVSNSPLREAVSRLERVGLIEVVPYAGPKVKALTESDVTDIYAVRMVLEELAVRLAADHGTPSMLDRMEEAIRAYEKACDENDIPASTEADRAFHDALVEASGNAVLLDMLPALSDRTQLLIASSAPRRRPTPRRGVVEGHRRILDALRKRDGEAAAQELRQELERGRGHLMRRIARAKKRARSAPQATVGE